MTVTTIGYIAGFLTTLAFVPQVVRAYRTRSVKDLSWIWLFIFSTGLFMWLTYGLVLNDWPMILANSDHLPVPGVDAVEGALQERGRSLRSEFSSGTLHFCTVSATV
jgi:MtN3 and saliva related transmembrane protein